MTACRIVVRIGAAALVRAQDGLDRPATAAAFLAALEPVLRRDVAELSESDSELVLETDLDAMQHEIRAEGPDIAICRRIEREVRDLVWVVREMVPFAVMA